MADLTKNNDTEILNQLSLLLYPESLESSKLFNCFSENLDAKVSNFMQVKEISKLVESESLLIEYLKRMNFFEYSLESNTVTYKLSQDLIVFDLVNIPLKLNQGNLLNYLNLATEFQNGQLLRVYKKSIFWYIVTTQDNEELVENKLKTAKIPDLETVLKYEKSNQVQIVNKLKKEISHSHYIKDSQGLKSNVVTNDNNSKHDNKLSWRKKSNDTNEDKKIQKGSHKNSNFSGFQRSGMTQAPNTQVNSGFVRNRYNSDGNQQIKNVYKPEKKIDEIEIDLSQINYSLKIKNKYTNHELLSYFDQFRFAKCFDAPPAWENSVEEVCADTRKKEFHLSRRERAMTYSMPIKNKFDDVQLNLNAVAYKLPTNHPLSGGYVAMNANK